VQFKCVSIVSNMQCSGKCSAVGRAFKLRADVYDQRRGGGARRVSLNSRPAKIYYMLVIVNSANYDGPIGPEAREACGGGTAITHMHHSAPT
jgi:hypothetical protein